ncbi:hypothetical protein SDC9_92867 [bioreactor metagenome]|uniref:Uncharacterized protein n=1 Tax=bioreactor metagenome TaxID=1076179 RepID=A0A644ZYX9_9ZZZZ
MQVAVAGVGTGGDHTEGDEGPGPGLDDVVGPGEALPEDLHRAHDLVGGHDCDERLRIPVGQHRRRPGDRIERIAADGLAEDVRRVDLRQLRLDDVPVRGTRADPDTVGAHDRLHPLVGEPQQALVPHEMEQLLRHPLAGQRPQPRPRSAGNDHDVTVGAGLCVGFR